MEIDWDKVDAVSGGLTLEGYQREILFTLGARYVLGGVSIPQPAAGHFVLLEIMKSPYITGNVVESFDTELAIFILVAGKDGVGAVLNEKIFGVPIKKRVEDFFQGLDGYDSGVGKVFINEYFENAMHGYNMIPGSPEDSEPQEMIFTNEWLAGYCATCHKMTGLGFEEIVWNFPMLFGGFCIAKSAEYNGKKNIERPKDWKAINDEITRQMEAKKHA